MNERVPNCRAIIDKADSSKKSGGMFQSANSDLTTAKVAAERELEGLLREKAMLEKGLAEGRAELNHNLLRLQALQGRDQELRDVVWKVLNFVPDVEEQYYSK
ncbi:hypothetical protein HDU79_009438, partial [Rhizoclosmatium sp. JEL0117]